MADRGYGAIAEAAVRQPSARNRVLLSYLLGALAVACVIAVVWFGHVENTTSLMEFGSGIADTYKSDATEKNNYIVVECWGGDLSVPVEDSEPCHQKFKELVSAHKYKSTKTFGSRHTSK